MQNWLRTAIQRELVMRSLKVAGIVGTILVFINQGDSLLAGGLPAAAIWKIPLTYFVPYCVSTYASVAAVLAKSGADKSQV
ncbi:MAG: nitrate/nitrite transporter NrtS [Proteobacteria bacterium]|nr:nitrate/nitrite transporter NrtS [Pseudomonadota bacterium]